jgi:sugar (glycoside-pentoside-hexuronide) transporter
VTDTNEKNTRFGIAWAVAYGGGPMAIFALSASYLSMFMTDIVGIPAATAAVILGVANLWDAINDPIMGIIADRTRSRWGRYRPYFLFVPILFAIFSTLAFLNPSFSPGGKVAWITVFYIGVGMTYTACLMPTYAIVPAHVKSFQERNKFVTWGGIVTSLGFFVINVFTLQIAGFFKGFWPLVAIIGVISVVSYFWLFFESKERYLIETGKRPIFQDLKVVFRHKELYPLLAIWLFCPLSFGVMMSSSVYYVMYYLARPDLIPVYMGVLSVASCVSMMVVMPFFLKFFKYGHKALMWSLLPSAILFLILFFTGNKSFTLLCVLTFISAALSAMENHLINLLMTDMVDFVQLKDGLSLNGILSSLRSFAYKCGTTLNISGTLAVLAATGYVAGAVGAQPESTMIGINVVRFLFPTILAILIVILCAFYPLEKYYPAIEKMKAEMQAKE